MMYYHQCDIEAKRTWIELVRTDGYVDFTKTKWIRYKKEDE